MAFSVKRCVGGRGGVRKGQEGNLGGHDMTPTCANLAFPVREHPGEARGREPPEPDRGGAVARSVSEPTGRAKPPAIPGRLVSERAVVARAG
jgi:hypothetical protein